jgi:hypothetical protein
MALALVLMVTSAFADQVALKDGHPDHYVVKKGDTLWDISSMFLNSPWLWPEIWYANPQVSNPHLIYPGDDLTLVYVDGKPQLRMQRGQRTVKLSPHARAESLDTAIPTIPLDAIDQFLSQPLVVGKDELSKAAYVVSSAGEHLVTGAGDRVYLRGISDESAVGQNLFRPGDTYVDPDSGEILGYEAIYLGEGKVSRSGDPATLQLTRTTREINIGDRALPATQESIQPYFAPHPASADMDGTIISVLDGVSQIGQYQVVVINRGTREGVDVGTVMSIEQSGALIRDQVVRSKELVKLPDEKAGLLMVFRTFEKVSYALVLKATQALHVGDKVRNPDNLS